VSVRSFRSAQASFAPRPWISAPTFNSSIRQTKAPVWLALFVLTASAQGASDEKSQQKDKDKNKATEKEKEKQDKLDKLKQKLDELKKLAKDDSKKSEEEFFKQLRALKNEADTQEAQGASDEKSQKDKDKDKATEKEKEKQDKLKNEADTQEEHDHEDHEDKDNGSDQEISELFQKLVQLGKDHELWVDYRYRADVITIRRLLEKGSSKEVKTNLDKALSKWSKVVESAEKAEEEESEE